MLPRVLEVFVRAQQHQIVPATQLDQQGVDRAHLHAFAAAGVEHLRRLNVVFAVGLQKLMDRATDGTVQEVILATNFNAEGEATAHVISEALRSRGVHVTRLARGVPVGSELEYVDLGTIAHALVDRR